MARPRKPTAELKLHGTYRKDRHGDRSDTAFPTGAPVKPDLDDAASWLWDTVADNMPPGGLSPIDAAMLTGAARWYSRWLKYDAMEPGDYKALVMACAAWKQFERCAARFGMSPQARAALKLPAAEGPRGKLGKYVS